MCSYLCHHVYSHADIVCYHLLHVVEVPLPPGDASSHAMQLRNTHARARTHAHTHRRAGRAQDYTIIHVLGTRTVTHRVGIAHAAATLTHARQTEVIAEGR